MPIRAKDAALLGRICDVAAKYGKKDSRPLDTIAGDTEPILFIVANQNEMITALGLQQLYPDKQIDIASLEGYHHNLARNISEFAADDQEQESEEEGISDALEILAHPDLYCDYVDADGELAQAVISHIDTRPYELLAKVLASEEENCLTVREHQISAGKYIAIIDECEAIGDSPEQALAILIYKLNAM